MKTSDIEAKYVDHMGSDLSVVNAARVSFHKVSEEFKDGDAKLINYLAKHKHYSPFNHTFLTFKIKAPIFVGRQLVKHRFMPWNEVSRRYVDEEPEFYIPDIRTRAENVKQGSGGIHEHEMFWAAKIEESCIEALKVYNGMLEANVAPEVARAVLPQNMMTEWWWSGTLGAYADMLRLRLDPHTQAESRIVATLIHSKVQELFPVSINALLDN